MGRKISQNQKSPRPDYITDKMINYGGVLQQKIKYSLSTHNTSLLCDGLKKETIDKIATNIQNGHGAQRSKISHKNQIANSLT